LLNLGDVELGNSVCWNFTDRATVFVVGWHRFVASTAHREVFARHVDDTSDVTHTDDTFNFFHQNCVSAFKLRPNFFIVELSVLNFNVSIQPNSDVVRKCTEDETN
jgi:hypothetical protein